MKRSSPHFPAFRPISTAAALATLAAAVFCSGCDMPSWSSREGRLVFAPKGAGRGAVVVGENGAEFRDRADIPQRVVVRDPEAPWKAPLGFILPADGKFTKTSTPTVLGMPGAIWTLRSSDSRVPSWGGEIFLRVDALAPSSSSRAGESIAIVVEGDGKDESALVDAALSQLQVRDLVTVIDARGPRVLVPSIPASHRSLALAATAARTLEDASKFPVNPDLGKAIDAAGKALGASGPRRLLILTEGREGVATKAARSAIERLAESGVVTSAVATGAGAKGFELDTLALAGMGRASYDADLDRRINAVRVAMPTAGLVLLRGVTISIAGSPSPTHVIESTGGEVRWLFEGGQLALGDLRQGDARAEILRVSVPSWVPGTKFDLEIEVQGQDALNGQVRTMRSHMALTYDDDIERIANSRHGDVIAYASALATMHRLHAAFVGDRVDRLGGLRPLAALHAKSLSDMGRDLKNEPFQNDARVLLGLLDAAR